MNEEVAKGRNEMIYRGYQCKSRRTAMETQVAFCLSSLFVIQRRPKNPRNYRWDENDPRSKEEKRKEERGKKKKEWRLVWEERENGERGVGGWNVADL